MLMWDGVYLTTSNRKGAGYGLLCGVVLAAAIDAAAQGAQNDEDDDDDDNQQLRTAAAANVSEAHRRVTRTRFDLALASHVQIFVPLLLT